MNIDDLLRDAEQKFETAKANNVCVVVPNFQLPANCTPPACRIGFERPNAAYKLLIDRGVVYAGAHAAFREFLRLGEHNEDTPEGMKAFLRSIEPAFIATEPVRPQHPPPPRTPPPAPETPAPPNPPAAPQAPPLSRLSGIVDTSGIVLEKLNPHKLDDGALRADYKSEICGQDQALDCIVDIVSNHYRKRKPKRPPSILLFGPPAVGKTMSAERLPVLLTKHTGQQWDFICIDGGQMGEDHTVSHLVGAPPGYLGHDRTPLLASVNKNPKTVILFDEFDRASPKMMEMIMGMMSSGRMSAFKEIHGKWEFLLHECILIFTTNLPLKAECPDLPQEDQTREYRAQLIQGFDGRPGIPEAIVSRFVEILRFSPLDDNCKVDLIALSIMELGTQHELNICKMSPDLLQSVVNTLTVENGAREPLNALSKMLDKAFSDFANEHDIRNVSLAGTADCVEVAPFGS